MQKNVPGLAVVVAVATFVASSNTTSPSTAQAQTSRITKPAVSESASALQRSRPWRGTGIVAREFFGNHQATGRSRPSS